LQLFFLFTPSLFNKNPLQPQLEKDKSN